MTQAPSQVEVIPIDRIAVINPRARNKKTFNEIVANIAELGLKRPITVARRDHPDGPRYDLICGQGRIEAYQSLGQREIPAVIVEAENEECLVMSLVENLARRHHRAIDLLHDIEGLKQRGYREAEIASKTGLTVEYVRNVVRLLKTGEHRLLRAVESGQMPVSVAVEIAMADDVEVQQVLQQAYEKKVLRGHKLVAVKRLVEQRRLRGKGRKTTDRPRDRPLSVERLLRTYRDDTDKKRRLVRKAETTRDRLVFVIEGLRSLLADDNFITLLRAEKLDTLPRNLGGRLGVAKSPSMTMALFGRRNATAPSQRSPGRLPARAGRDLAFSVLRRLGKYRCHVNGRLQRRRPAKGDRHDRQVGRTMAKADQIRCAVYTRKSSEEGLEQSFNSLHAQREACESYIASQRHEGWCVVHTPYDDGGFSGGSMVRPALQQLLTDIKAGNVDVVVVYKIDRLTRSLFDFAKIVETFDAHKVSFVSVTQSFNTTTSMGRLTLNVLLSFAQFEREVTGERIRDKIAASKKKGMWMGGSIPLGYDLRDHKLVINHVEAAVVNTIFRLYAELGTLRKLKTEVDQLRLRTKPRTIKGATAGGLLFRVGHLSALLSNPTYRGLVRHKGNLFTGDHPAIITADLWDRVHSQLASNTVARRSGEASKEPSSLAGLLFDKAGNRMTPSHAVKNGKRYRYYVSHNLVTGHIAGRRPNDKSGLRIPAQELEGHVASAIGAYLGDAQRIDEDLIALHTPPTQRNHITRQARALAKDLGTVGANKQSELMHKFVTRVVVSNSELTVLLDRRKIAEQIEALTDKCAASSTTAIELRIPVNLRRVGQEKRLIIAAHVPAINLDPVLITAVAKAHRWFEMLKSGEVQTMGALARAEKVQRTYITSLLPLALLAPDITEAILEGRQPVDLSLQRFRSIVPLPIEWSEQRRALGF